MEAARRPKLIFVLMMFGIFACGFFAFELFNESADSVLSPAIYQDIDCPEGKEVDTLSFEKQPSPAVVLLCEGNFTYAIPEQLIIAVGQSGWVVRRSRCGHVISDLDSNQLASIFKKISLLEMDALSNEGDTVGKTCSIQINFGQKKSCVLFNENPQNRFRYSETEKGKKWLKALEILDAIPTRSARNIFVEDLPK